MRKITGILVLFLAIWSPAIAGGNDINLKQFYGQFRDTANSQFNSLCKDLGQALNFIPLAPPEPYGITGFDVGVGITLLKINQDSDYWKYATSDMEQPPMLPVPKLSAQKGLPLGLDVGAVLAFIPQSNVKLVGAELRWALLRGGFVKPAIGIRGSYTKLLGIPHLNFQTETIDASISKQIAIITPYVGVGQVFTQGKASFDYTDPDTNAVTSVELNTKALSETRGIAGIRLSMLLLSITAEVDFSRIISYNFKLSAGF